MPIDDVMSRRAQARHNAVRRLISKYQEEFDEMHRQERVNRGLPPNTEAPNALRERVRYLESEVERLNRRIHEGGDT